MPAANTYWLGTRDYRDVWSAMRIFTDNRGEDTHDQIWFLEHFPVFTQGQAGKAEHVLLPGSIPVVASDRGGQVTYHGPGQLVVYPLVNLKNLRSNQGMGIRSLVEALEQAMVGCLKRYDISALGNRAAPGVYVDGKKIGSIGLRVRKQACYHGISLNVRMDLEPFSRINPCGYEGLEMTQISDFYRSAETQKVASDLHEELSQALGLQFSAMEDVSQSPLTSLTTSVAAPASP